MSATIDEKLAQDVTQIVEKQRELAEKFGVDSSEYKRYVEESDKKMKEFDEKTEQLNKDLSEEKKENEELKERVQHLEKLSNSFQGRTNEEQRKSLHDVVNAICKKKWNSFVEDSTNVQLAEEYFSSISKANNFPDEAKQFENFVLKYKETVRENKSTNDILRTDIGEMGGFLVPEYWSQELLRQIIETSPCRAFARIRSTGGKTLHQPIRQGVPIAQWEGETETGVDSVSNYTDTTLTTHRLSHTVPVTWDMLNDSAYNISEELMTDSKIAFGRAEGLACVSGDAIKKPLGFTQDSDVPVFTSATSTLTFDDMINITGELKSGYNPMYMFNRKTLAYLRTLKDQNDRYLWNTSFGDSASGAPATINGYRYSSNFIDMNDFDVADGFPVLFADFYNFYTIVDRTDMVVIRDEYTRKKQSIVEFTFNKWTHGQPVIKEAGILLKKQA